MFTALKKEVIKASHGDVKDSVLIAELMDEAIKKLSKSERNNTLIGLLSLAAVGLTLASDFLTAGIASQILNIIKPIVSLTFFYFDVIQLKNGVEDSKPISKFNRYLRIALTILCIAIAITTFVGSGVATGGALPIALLVIGIVCPLISLYISNNKQKVAHLSKRLFSYIKSWNENKKKQTTTCCLSSKKYDYLESQQIEMTPLFKKALKAA